MTLALSQTAACQVTFDHSCPDGTKKEDVVEVGTGTGAEAVERGDGGEEDEATEEGGKEKETKEFREKQIVAYCELWRLS